MPPDPQSESEAPAPAIADAPPSPASEAGSRWDSKPDNSAIVTSLQTAVGRLLPAIDATVARFAAGPMRPREMEQAARALASLTRTLRELNALLSQRQAAVAAETPPDVDELRYELARRMRAFIQERTGEVVPEEPVQHGST